MKLDMVVTVIFLIVLFAFVICELFDKDRTNLFKIQCDQIKEGKALWILMALILVIYSMFSFYEIAVNDSIKDACAGVVYSIVAAFLFYLFTDFYPKSRKTLELYGIIARNASSLMGLFGCIQNEFSLAQGETKNAENSGEHFRKLCVRYQIEEYCSQWENFYLKFADSLRTDLRQSLYEKLTPFNTLKSSVDSNEGKDYDSSVILNMSLCNDVIKEIYKDYERYCVEK